MEFLPNDIVCKIFCTAEVPVDTYLAFRKYGVVPKKLSVPTDFKDHLNRMLKRRKRGYDEYMRMQEETNGFAFIVRMDQVFKRVNKDVTVELEVSEKHGNIQYSFMVVRLPSNLLSFGIRRGNAYDIHTGEEVAY